MGRYLLFIALFLTAYESALGQTGYKVVSVEEGGTISGTVKWSGPVPHNLVFPITKDP